MMKRFLVFIFLLLTTGFSSAQDMPPLPSNAPASDIPAQGAPVTTSNANSSAASSAAPPAASSDLPPLPDSTGSSAAPVSSNSAMPALPDSGSASAASSQPVSSSTQNEMPPLPDSSTAPSAPVTPVAAAVSPSTTAQMAPMANQNNAAPEVHPRRSGETTKVTPEASFGGWIRAKGNNMTSRLAWASQQILNAMDAKSYKMVNEEGVYDGEQIKGPQYRKFTYQIPGSGDTVYVLLKQVGEKIWFRIGPDEEPSLVDHTFAQVVKISQESRRVLRILKTKFRGRMIPHRFIPSWGVKFDHVHATLDE